MRLWIPALAGMTISEEMDLPCHSRENGNPGFLSFSKSWLATLPLN